MPVYRIEKQSLVPLEKTTFKDLKYIEPRHLQPLVKSQIGAISEDLLVVYEEFSKWDDSNLRIDLLCVDKKANVVVIELKRTKEGGLAELQAIRYASMISSLRFDQLVKYYQEYLDKNSIALDAQDSLLKHFNWNEPREDLFCQDVKIILASADFSTELTTSVMWLLTFGIDIKCVRMKPYLYEKKVIIDFQTIIPLPETADFQVSIREKKEKEKQSKVNRDYTKYDIYISDKPYYGKNKRKMIQLVISYAINKGNISPAKIQEASKHLRENLFKDFRGKIGAEKVQYELRKQGRGGETSPDTRYFCKDDEIFIYNNNTYVLTNQWWDTTAEDVANAIAEEFPKLNIRIEISE